MPPQDRVAVVSKELSFVADIFREVDEDVRKDKAHALWKKYGAYVIIACAALVVGTGARVAWREYQASQQLDEAGRFADARQLLADGKSSEAINALQALSSDASSGYSAIAGFHEAQARAQAGDTAGAVQTYDRLAGDGAAGPALRQLAALMAAMVLLDDGAAADVERRLTPLTADANPWRFMAREMMAALKLRQGDRDGARAAYKSLSEDAAAPGGVRNRAQEMLSALAK
jgi:hypothetical protein